MRGGKRKGAGRKKKFENPTTINFKIEKLDKEAVKEKYGSQLNQMFLKWVKDLIKL